MTSCSASTEQDGNHVCEKAFDGNLDNWATKGEGVGAWIKVNFDGSNRVTRVMVLPRERDAAADGMFKDIKLEFQDMSTAVFTLSNAYEWNEIKLTGSHISSYVKITATSVYSQINNGFAELQVFGCPSGTRA